MQNKRKLKKSIIQNEKGSITLFVLIAMLFFIITLLALYVSNNTKVQAQLSEIEKVEKNYNYSDSDILSFYNQNLSDSVGPTLTITSNVSSEITNVETITYTFKFSEDVKDFEFSDINITNGEATDSNFSSSNASTYTLTVTNPKNANGQEMYTQTIEVDEGACTDLAENPNKRASKEVKIDRTPPSEFTITADYNVNTQKLEITNSDVTDNGAGISKFTYQYKQIEYNNTFEYPYVINDTSHNNIRTENARVNSGYVYNIKLTVEDKVGNKTESNILTTFGIASTYNTQTNLEDIETFAEYVNNSANKTDGMYVYLMSEDIWTRNENEISIGTETVSFNGIFDGNNCTIHQRQTNGSGSYTGLFVNNNGEIRDLKLSQIEVSGQNSVGFVGKNSGKLDNVHLVDSTIIATGNNVGGLVGANTGTITNCSVEDSKIIATGDNVGGLVGNATRNK